MGSLNFNRQFGPQPAKVYGAAALSLVTAAESLCLFADAVNCHPFQRPFLILLLLAKIYIYIILCLPVKYK